MAKTDKDREIAQAAGPEVLNWYDDQSHEWLEIALDPSGYQEEDVPHIVNHIINFSPQHVLEILDSRDHYKRMWAGTVQDASEVREQLANLYDAKTPHITKDQVEAAVQAATEAMEYVTNGDPELDIEYKKAWAAVKATLIVLGLANLDSKEYHD